MKINNHHIFWLLFASSSIFIAMFGEWILIPDSYEQSIVAECWSSGTSNKINCSEIFPYFRPPIPSLPTHTLPFMESLCDGGVVPVVFLLIEFGNRVGHSNINRSDEYPHMVSGSVGLLLSLFGTDCRYLDEDRSTPFLLQCFCFKNEIIGSSSNNLGYLSSIAFTRLETYS